MVNVTILKEKITNPMTIRFLPWIMAGLFIFVALFQLIFQPDWIGDVFGIDPALFWIASGIGAVAIFVIANRVSYFMRSYQEMQTQVEDSEQRVVEAYQRLEAIFRISQKFVEASDENEVVELVLKLTVDLVGATGASFVPLDEHGQPLTAISQGEMPFPVMTDWLEYLASPAVRERCQTCELHEQISLEASCPLLKGPFSDAIGLYCLPLRRGEREFGMLNLFLPDVEALDDQTQDFLQAMMDETALALEGVRLRRREMAALRQMQAVREKTDLGNLLKNLLGDVQETLEADFAMLLVRQPGSKEIRIARGKLPDQAQTLYDSILQGVMRTGEPLFSDDILAGTLEKPVNQTMMAAPLLSPQYEQVGALLVGTRNDDLFHQRQVSLLQTVAGQVALIVQNANLMAELEYQTMVQERMRLAREIHDGLAQTLGFLKLNVAQMQNYLARDDYDHLRKSAELCYNTISDAYQDARFAIDGLRIHPTESGLVGWLAQTVKEFKEISGIKVELEEVSLQSELPPEVHAQLIRIIQEALSNVRKHANASQVNILCRETESDLWLDVCDDGLGFSPEDVPGPSRHGLRGMRERAELIGADFQVVSRPGEGTRVRVRMPFSSTKSFQTKEEY